MINEYVEAILYDWHNFNILGHQNKDINFYINYIKNKKIKNTLVVGAGTGRVAIPMAKYSIVDALDISTGRLIKLSEKSEKVNIISSDFLDYNTLKKYDLIVFPYSTIQAFDNKLYFKILNKIKSILNDNGICLIDYDESFSSCKSTSLELKCSGFCKGLNANVCEYDKTTRDKDGINVERHFFINDNELVVNEKWYFFNVKDFNDSLYKTKMIISNIYEGYSKRGSKHKKVIELVNTYVDK